MSNPSSRLAPVALAIAVVAASCAAAPLAHAQAAAAPVAIAVSAQPLGSALNELARQAKLQLMAPPELVVGKQAPAVSGTLTAREALDKLLAGSGLVANIDGAVVIVRKAPEPPPAARSGHDGTLPTVNVVAAPNVRDAAITEGTGSYTTRALTIGKMEQSIRETPQSVTVVTRQQMDDLNLVTLEDVLAQTTGTSKSQRNFGAHVYMMRGYVLPESNFLLDGVSGVTYNPTGWVPVDTAIFDRVEVLRGAGAVVVGAGDPSGVINMVRKRPRAEKHFDVAFSAGSWNNFRTEIDAGGAFNEAGTVRGRVVAAYQDREYFYDVTHSKEPMVYGVIDADLTRDTKATVGLRHQKVDIDGYAIFGLPWFSNNTPIDVARSTQVAQKWNRHEAVVNDVFAEVEHRFNGDWRGKVTVSHGETDITQKLGTIRGAVDPITLKGPAFTSLYFTDRDIKADGLDANVTGSFEAFGGKHQAMFGADWSDVKSGFRSTSLSRNIPVDIYNINHSLVPEPNTPAYANSLLEHEKRKSIYGSARLQLAKPLHLLVGGRFNWYDFRATNQLTGAITNSYKQNAEFTPYAGVVYDLTREWSLYASYASTFTPQTQYFTVSGEALKPAVGANYEAGVKGELMDGKLNVALSVFSIKKRDVAVLDTANAGLCPGISTSNCYRNVDTMRSTGYDLEAAGQIARGWEVSAGYTRLKTWDPTGTPLSTDTPKHLLRAATSYRLPGDLQDWTIGASLSARSNSSVPPIENPGRAILDLRAAYRINTNWQAAVNVGNVFDKHYWEIIGGTRNGNYYGTPRNVMLTVRGSF